MSKRPYRLLLHWQDRKWGPQIHRTTEEASSMRRAISQALKAFYSDKTRRKERADAHAALSVSAVRPRLHDSPARKH